MFCVSLFAQSNAALLGKYVMVSMIAEGVELMDLWRELGMDTEVNYIELRRGGRLRMLMFENEMRGSFKVSGDTITITSDNQSQTLKINENRITMENPDGDGFMVFERDVKPLLE